MGAKPIFHFGQYRLDSEARMLLANGQIIPLTPKVVDLLRVLVGRKGQVISKDDLNCSRISLRIATP